MSVEQPQFPRMGNLPGAGILPGNRVQALHNGVQIFPAMLEAIRNAQETVTFETFPVRRREGPRRDRLHATAAVVRRRILSGTSTVVVGTPPTRLQASCKQHAVLTGSNEHPPRSC